MSNTSLGPGEDLQQYLLDVSLHESAICQRQQTVTMAEGMMLSSPERVQLRGLPRLRRTLLNTGSSGWLITLDNTLWSGSVVDPEDDEEDTIALRKLNSWLYSQQEYDYDLSLVPIGDGLTLLREA